MEIDQMGERLLIYTLLGNIYKQGISAETIKIFAEKEIMTDLSQQIDLAGWQQGVIALQKEVSNNIHRSSYLDELNTEYMRLFVGPEHLEAPPWESVYLTREHLLCGEPTFQVKNIYRSFGLTIHTGEKEPDDHIGLELLFMAKLCEKILSKWGNHQLAQEEITGHQLFLEQHLMQWVPTFCSDLQKATKQQFFVQLAILTGAWLESDLTYIKEQQKKH